MPRQGKVAVRLVELARENPGMNAAALAKLVGCCKYWAIIVLRREGLQRPVGRPKKVS